jgi:hypothetical protein
MFFEPNPIANGLIASTIRKLYASRLATATHTLRIDIDARDDIDLLEAMTEILAQLRFGMRDGELIVHSSTPPIDSPKLKMRVSRKAFPEATASTLMLQVSLPGWQMNESPSIQIVPALSTSTVLNGESKCTR